MTIQEQILKDLKEAMITKDVNLRDYLRVVISEFNRIGKELSDEIVKKELNKLRENAKIMQNDYELAVIKNYLPDKLDERATKVIVLQVIEEYNITSIKEMGKLMGALKRHPQADLIDNTIAAGFIKEILS